MTNIWEKGENVRIVVHTNVEHEDVAMYMDALQKTSRTCPIIKKGVSFEADVRVLSVISELDMSNFLYNIILSGVVV